jgi:hypothetical protein
MLQSFLPLSKSEEVWKIRNFGKTRAVGDCMFAYEYIKATGWENSILHVI